MTIDYQAVLEVFRTETEENLENTEEALVALEDAPDAKEPLQAAFRNIHTLKGNAQSVGLGEVAELAHVVEDLLERVGAGRLPLTQELATVLLSSVDALRMMVGRRMRPGKLPVGEGEPRLSPGAAATLRVNVAKLDHLLNLVGEVAVAREQLGTVLEALEPREGATARDVHHDADRLYVELQEAALATRMVPVGPSFRHYARVVRDAARAEGKQARLTIEGESVDLDTHTVQTLRDPLTHILRNAIAHGIEPPEQRVAMGKKPEGRIVIVAHREGASISLEVSDDGGGIDVHRVKARAVALGLVDAEARLTDAQVSGLLFRPGFSTTDEVSDLAGRGVGMDVVRKNVESLRGRVEVRWKQGAGTTIALRLPLTVAIITGFSFLVAEQTFVLPIEVVSECLESRSADKVARFGVANVHGAPVPFVRLRRFWELSGPDAERESLIVVEHEGRRIGLVVDELHGSGQTVIKPLGRVLSQLGGISGSAITGTGRVALIVDVPTLLRRVLRERPTFTEDESCKA